MSPSRSEPGLGTRGRISNALNQIETFGFRHGVKLDLRWLITQIHQNEQAFVVLRTEMAYQVALGLPLRLVAKSMLVAIILKNSATHAPWLNLGWPYPGIKSPTQFSTLCRTHDDAYALDNQVCLP